MGYYPTTNFSIKQNNLSLHLFKLTIFSLNRKGIPNTIIE